LRSGTETIVYDQKCSRIVPDTIHSLGGTPLRERSGHTFIKTAFIKSHAAYAGELSGHHFFREIEGDDGLYASLVFAEILQASQEKLSTLMQVIPSYPITPDIRIPMASEDIERFIFNLAHNLEGQAQVETSDGVRLEFPHGWALVRPSVTEPVVSLRFEGQDEASLRQVIRSVVSASGFEELESLLEFPAK
jgi:phosphomannomutase/phosphoglucomutase